MSSSAQSVAGSVVAIWRYPVKSMLGEEVDTVEVTARGLFGDRAYALIDSASGKIVSVKNPRKWSSLLSFRAGLTEPLSAEEAVGPVKIVLPDGNTLSSDRDDAEEILSRLLGREVRLTTSPPEAPSLEKLWPDVEGLDHRDSLTEESIPSGSFFDGAAVHLLTTATIRRLADLYPQGQFDARRYRPNIVVEPTEGRSGFVENQWIGRTLVFGDTVRLKIDRPCPRCVVTTLAQGDLVSDLAILRTAVEHNGAHVGVYASVVAGGTVRRDDPVRFE